MGDIGEQRAHYEVLPVRGSRHRPDADADAGARSAPGPDPGPAAAARPAGARSAEPWPRRPFSGTEPLVGEIVGLRTFRVDESGMLLPLYSNHGWYDGANTATCAPPTGEAERTDHPVPSPECECGFYAYGTEAAAARNRQHALRPGRRVVLGERRGGHAGRAFAARADRRAVARPRRAVVAAQAGRADLPVRPAVLGPRRDARRAPAVRPARATSRRRAAGRCPGSATALAGGALLSLGALPPVAAGRAGAHALAGHCRGCRGR